MSINPTGVWAFKSWGRQHVFGVTGQIIPSRLSAYCILNVLKRYSTPAPPLGSIFRLQKHLVCYGTLKKKQKGYKVLIGSKVWQFSGYFLYHWLIFCCMNIVHTPMLIWLEGIGERWQLQEEMWLLKKNLAPLIQGLNSAFKNIHMSTWVLVKAFSFNAFWSFNEQTKLMFWANIRCSFKSLMQLNRRNYAGWYFSFPACRK